jgi:hypothetical protein
LAFKIFSPFQGSNGSRICNLSEVSLTVTSILEPSDEGAKYPASSTSNPFGGSSQPVGSSSLTFSPSLFVHESVIGLKSNLPDIAIAATISGDATNA